MKLLPVVLGLALVPNASLALVWNCEFPRICDEETCGEASFEAKIIDDGEWAEIHTPLDELAAVTLSHPDSADLLYASPSYYGETTMVTVFASGDARMTVHGHADGDTWSATYIGKCAEEG